MSHAIRLPCDEAAIRAGTPEPRVERAAGPWVLAATILGSSLAFIDGTVVTVALPAMGRELDATGADMQWVIEAYALFLSALLLVGGSLGDRFGRRRVFALGILLFTVASIGCGLSRSIFQLILARCIQGIGGALLVPGSLALIAASFDSRARGRAIGTWSGFSGVTTAVGPLLGGWLVEYSWRWAFFINVPVAAVVLLLLQRVPESRNPGASRLDLAGGALATLGLGGIVFGLIESSRRGWDDPNVVAGLLLGFLALLAFVWVERHAAAPMLPLYLFRSPTFTGANALTLFLYGALGCVFFFLPLNLIQVHGYSPLEAGAAMLPFILVLFVLSRWSGGLVARYGTRTPLLVGSLVAAAGLYLLGMPGTRGSYWGTFFPGMLVLGFGMALCIAPLTTGVMNAAGEENAGVASGINNAVSRVAGLLAIALLGVLLAGVFQSVLKRGVETLQLPEGVESRVLADWEKLGAATPPEGLGADEAAAVSHAIDEAYVAGFRAVARSSALLAVIAALCAWIWIDRPPRRRSFGSSVREPVR